MVIDDDFDILVRHIISLFANDVARQSWSDARF